MKKMQTEHVVNVNDRQSNVINQYLALESEFLALTTDFEKYNIHNYEPGPTQLVVKNVQKSIYEKIKFIQNKIQSILKAHVGRVYWTVDLNSKIIKLLIRIQITLGDIEYITQDENCRKAASMYFYAICITNLKIHMQGILFEKDYSFQQNIFNVFNAIQGYVKDNTQLFGNIKHLYQVGFNFAKKCQPTPIKVALYVSFLSEKIKENINDKKYILNAIAEFDDLYKTIQSVYLEYEQKNTLKTHMKLDLMLVNIMTARFKLNVHPKVRRADLDNEFKLKNKLFLMDYFRILVKNLDEYITPMLDVIVDIPDVEWGNQPVLFISGWNKIANENFNIFLMNLNEMIGFYDVLNTNEDAVHKKNLLLKIGFLYNLTRSFFDFVRKKIPQMHLDEKINKIMLQTIDTIEIILSKEKKLLSLKEIDEKDNRKNSDQFIKELDEEAKIKSEKKVTLINQMITQSQVDNEEEDPALSLAIIEENSTLNLFKLAGIAYEKKEYTQAYEVYSEIYQLGDDFQKFQAIDGLLHTSANLLFEQLEKMSQILSSRLHGGSYLPKQEQSELETLIKKSETKLDYLNNFYHEYKNFYARFYVLEEKENQQGIIFAKLLIRDLFNRITSKCNDVHASYQQLMQLKAEKKINRLKKLGLEKAQTEGDLNCTEEEIIAHGRKALKRLYREKQNNQGLNYAENNVFRENEVLSKLHKHLCHLNQVGWVLQGDASAQVLSKRMAIVDATIDLKNPVFMKVVLPETIQSIFSLLDKISQDHYLVGSTVIQLYLGDVGRKIQVNDKDFVTASATHKSLISNCFSQSRFMNNLYTIYHNNDLIELFCLEKQENWRNSLIGRDFTISALCCDRYGIITDPTGLGFSDLNERLIRMIGDPWVRINKSPVIALRAIKYQLWGFACEKNLEIAIRQWEPNADTNYAHLYAVVAKEWARFDKVAYLKFLKDYQLLNKIFKIAYKGNWHETIADLEIELNRHKPSLLAKQSFFNDTKNNPSISQKPMLPLGSLSMNN